MSSRTVFIITILSVILFTAASDSCLDKWEGFSHSAGKRFLKEWMMQTARVILSGDKKYPGLDFALPANPDCTGMFITLIKKGTVRGCYGAFNHSFSSPSIILRDYIKGALYLDQSSSSFAVAPVDSAWKIWEFKSAT